MKSKVFLLLILASILSVQPIFSQEQAAVSEIHLKSGEIFKGEILSQSSEELVLKTSRGELKIKTDEIESIQYGSTLSENDPAVERISNEIAMQKISNRKTLDLIGLSSIYGITIVGDISRGGKIGAPMALIPGPGPILAAFVLDESDYYDPSGIDTDRMLLVLSGAIQSYFLFDWLRQSGKESKLKSQGLTLGFNPRAKQLLATVRF